MALVLNIVYPEHLDSMQQRKASFGARDGYIGRSDDNTWVIFDENKHVGRRHAKITRQPGGGYLFVDHSTNGTYIRKIGTQKEEFFQNEEMPLEEGDVICIGEYEIAVEEAVPEEDASIGGFQSTAGASYAGEPGISHQEDAGLDDNPGRFWGRRAGDGPQDMHPGDHPARSRGRRASDMPPEPLPDDQAFPPSTRHPGSFGRDEPAPEPLSQPRFNEVPSASEFAGEGRFQPEDSPPPAMDNGRSSQPFSMPDMGDAGMEEPVADAHSRGRGEREAFSAPGLSGGIPSPTDVTVVPVADGEGGGEMSASGGQDFDLMVAFLEGLGVDPSGLEVTPELAYDLGGALRESVVGLIRLMEVRSKFKFTVGLEVTRMKGRGLQNALKVTQSPDIAIDTMVLGRPGYLNMPDTFAEAFSDSEVHLLAMGGAIQNSLANTLALVDRTFSPEAIEKFVHDEKKALLVTDSKRWKTFVERYESIDMQDMLSNEIENSYSDQVESLARKGNR